MEKKDREKTENQIKVKFALHTHGLRTDGRMDGCLHTHRARDYAGRAGN